MPVRDLHFTQLTIRSCFGRGIALYAVEGAEIEDCKITDNNDEAIDLDHFTRDVRVSGNVLERSLIGVKLNDAVRCTVEKNEIRNCGVGLHVWRWCKQPGLNERHAFTQNRIADTRGNALQLGTGSSGCRIRGNTISGAGRNGISLAGEGHVVEENRFDKIGREPVFVSEGKHAVDVGTKPAR